MKSLNDNYEPSASLKASWISAPATPRFYGGFLHPGFFTTVNYVTLLLLVLLATALEFYGGYNFYRVTNMVPTAIVFFVLLDGIAAWLKVVGRARRVETQARISASENTAEEEAWKARLPSWIFFANLAGILTIVGLAAFKIVGFLSEVGTDTPGGTVMAVIVSYVLAAVIHLLVTGHFINATLYVWRRNWERRGALREYQSERATNIIKAPRNHEFFSGVALVPCSLDKHSLEIKETTPNGILHCLTTWGVLTDPQLDSLINFQPRAEQKATLAREGLRHQIDILKSEPQGLAKSKSPAPATPHASTGTTALVLFVMLASAMTSCAERSRPPQMIPVNIVTAAPLCESETSKLPAEIAALVAPDQAYKKDHTNLLPTVHLIRLDLAPAEAHDILPKIVARKTFFRWFSGGGEDTRSILRARKAIVSSPMALASLAQPNPDSWKASALSSSLAEWLEKCTQAEDTILVFQKHGEHPSPSDTHSPVHLMRVGGRDVAAVPAGTTLPEAVKQAVEQGVKAVHVLYDLPLTPKNQSPPPIIAKTEEPRSVNIIQPAPAPPVAPSPPLTTEARFSGPPHAARLFPPLARAFLRSHAENVPVSIKETKNSITLEGTVEGAPVRLTLLIQPSDSPPPVSQSPPFQGYLTSREEAPGSTTGPLAAEAFPGFDALEVLVSRESTITGPISMKQLALLLQGRPTRMPTTTPAENQALIKTHVLESEATSDSLTSTRLGIGGGGRGQLHPNDAALRDALASDPWSLGIGTWRSGDSRMRPLAVMADEGNLPCTASPSNVARKAYPLWRRIRIVVPAAPAGIHSAQSAAHALARRFVEYCDSRRAAPFATEAGFVPEGVLISSPTLPELPLEGLHRTKLPGDSGVNGPVLRRYAELASLALPLPLAIHFDFNDAKLDPAAQHALNRVVDMLRNDPNYRGAQIITAGFSDSIGGRDQCHKVARKRSEHVAEWLTVQGHPPSVITEFGPLLPIATNSTQEGRALNRRVEIWLKLPATPAAPSGAQVSRQ